MNFQRLIIDQISYQYLDSIMNNRSVAVFGIVALFTLVVFTAIVPSVMVSNATAKGPKPCNASVYWSSNISPSVEYAPGTSLYLTVTEKCPASGSATITTPTGTSTVTFTCPCSATTVYMASPTTPGLYSISASIATSEYSTGWGINFSVTPQFPAGMILAVLAPIAALLGYVQFRKPAYRKV